MRTFPSPCVTNGAGSSPLVRSALPARIPTGGRPFDGLAAELAAERLADAPTLGSALGLTEYDELLPVMSAAAIDERVRREDGWLRRFADLPEDDLEPAERIDRDLVVMALRGRSLMRDWADWRRSPDHYAGVALEGVHGLLLRRLRPEPELARAVAARLRATPELLVAGTENLDPDLAHPALLRRSLAQIRAGVGYARSLADQFADDSARADVAAAGVLAAAAFARFGAHVADLAERARGEWAIGEDRYDGLLRSAEGLRYGARELRERGRAAYDELAADLRRRTSSLRGHDDWRAVLAELAGDHPSTPEEMLAAYAEATAQARRFCVERELVSLPAGERCAVEPAAPFTRRVLAVAHYLQPPPFAPPGANGVSRNIGHFFVPYPPDDAPPEQVQQRLASNNSHGLWSIATHEAYPGHHWHFAWLAAHPPRVLRALFGSTYFVEGWGLYSEDLMREQGFFATPEQELCQREMRLFRAARIVVDTSLHLGEMSIEEAGDFLCAKASMSPETARAEVLRYCAWPTQAASYLTGALEIARMRDRWFAEGRGTLCAFHDAAAGSGRLPICLVERAVFGDR